MDVSSDMGFHLVSPSTGIVKINTELANNGQKKLLDKLMNKVIDRIIEGDSNIFVI